MFKDQITVIITSSIIPSHPSTQILDDTLEYIHANLPDVHVMVLQDGIRQEQREHFDRYEQYKANRKMHDWVTYMDFPRYMHQAAMMREALPSVTTPLVLFVEHDWLLLPPIPWEAMVKTLLDGDADVIRLHQEHAIHPEHAHLFLDLVEINGIPLRKMRVFWAQPHLARTDWYRKQLAEKFSPFCRTFIEDRLYGINLDTPWEDNKVFMYQPRPTDIAPLDYPVGSYKRVKHTDGRGKDETGAPLMPKFDDRLIF